MKTKRWYCDVETFKGLALGAAWEDGELTIVIGPLMLNVGRGYSYAEEAA